MKAKRTLLIIGLWGALQTVAFSQGTNTVLSASTTSPRNSSQTTQTNYARVQPVQSKPEPTYSTMQYQLVEPKLAKLAGKENNQKILRLGNESSRAWTTIASQQPNSTLVHDLATHEPTLCLCSFSFGRR